jgi:conjugative relaxase-like TrwC/TraI family protein
MLNRDQLAALVAGNREDGPRIPGKHYAKQRVTRDPKTGQERTLNPIGSYNFTTNAHKDVSIIWALADPAERAKILAAHVSASRAAMQALLAEVATARRGKGGTKGREQGAAALLEVNHFTSRREGNNSADMNLHTHFLVPNAVFCSDGKIGSLDTLAIRSVLRSADGVYQAELGQNLRDLGYDIGIDIKTNSVCIPAVTKELRDLFSKRQNQGVETAKRVALEKGEDWANLTEKQRETRIDIAIQPFSGKSNRNSKDDAPDFTSWREQARALGWHHGQNFKG